MRRGAMTRRPFTAPFLLAAQVVDLELMRLLLDLGADPLSTNEDGTTALLAAAGVAAKVAAVARKPVVQPTPAQNQKQSAF